MMTTWFMKLEGNLPAGHDALLLSISGTGYVLSHRTVRTPAGHTKAIE